MLLLALQHKNKVQVESEGTRLGAYRQKLSGLSLLPRLNGVVVVVASARGYACKAIGLLFGCGKELVYGKTFGASCLKEAEKVVATSCVVKIVQVGWLHRKIWP
jgi:hypothetical protein